MEVSPLALSNFCTCRLWVLVVLHGLVLSVYCGAGSVWSRDCDAFISRNTVYGAILFEEWCVGGFCKVNRASLGKRAGG